MVPTSGQSLSGVLDFGRSDNPISTGGGADYAPHITNWPPYDPKLYYIFKKGMGPQPLVSS